MATKSVLQNASDLFETFIFVGGYSRKMGWANGHSNGVEIFSFNTSNGSMSHQNSIHDSICGVNPTFIKINDKTNMLYAANEYSMQSQLTGLQFDDKFLPIHVFSTKSTKCDPCHMSSDLGFDHLYVANYGGESGAGVGVYQVDHANNGDLNGPICKDVMTGINGCNAIPDRQALPHMHCIMPCKRTIDSNEFYCTDLGRDILFHYKMEMDLSQKQMQLSVVSQLSMKKGDGVRHICYHPSIDGIMYASMEMGSHVSVIEYDYESNELKRILQRVSSLPDSVLNDCNGSEFTASQVLCDATGKYLYVANRGHDSIVCYQIDQMTGLLKLEQEHMFVDCNGKVPRHFNIDPSNRFLVVANQESDNVAVFKINHEMNGKLEFVHCVAIGCPTCIQFYQRPRKLTAKL